MAELTIVPGNAMKLKAALAARQLAEKQVNSAEHPDTVAAAVNRWLAAEAEVVRWRATASYGRPKAT